MLNNYLSKVTSFMLALTLMFAFSANVNAAKTVDSETGKYEISMDFEDESLTTASSQDDIAVYIQNNSNLVGVYDALGYVFENFGADKSKAEIVEDATFGKSLKLTINWGTGASMHLFRSDVNVTDNVSVQFSVNNTNASEFGCQFDGSASVRAVDFGANSVYFFGEPVQSYDLKTWYDVKIDYVHSTSTARLSIKKSENSDWNTYEVMLAGNNKTALSGGYNKIRIGAGDWKNGAISLVDNISVSTTNAIGSIIPTFYESDFNEQDSFAYYRPQFGDAYEKGKWAFENFYSANDSSIAVVTADIESLEGYGNVLSIENLGQEYKYTTLTMYPFGAANSSPVPDVTHHLSFKFGYDSARSRVQTCLMLNSAAAEPTYCNPIEINGGQLVMNGVIVENVEILAGKLYDVELLSNKEGLAKVIFTDLDGTQYVSDMTLGTGGVPYAFYYFMPTGDASKTYVDDFKWDIFFADAFAVGDVTIASGYDKAALDESVKIALNQTADLSANELAVTVKKNGEPINVDYKLISTADGMEISFEKLDKSSDYTVTVSGIKNIAGEAVASQEISFTTQDFEYDVLQPVISEENVITVSAGSAYYKSASLYVIAAEYDQEGELTQVKHKVINPNNLQKQDFVFNPEFTQASKVRAFVWTDFNSMIPVAPSAQR